MVGVSNYSGLAILERFYIWLAGAVGGAGEVLNINQHAGVE